MNRPPPPPNPSLQTDDLRSHLALCEEVLRLVTDESEALRGAGTFASQEFAQQRNDLLPRLIQSLDALRRLREAWLELEPAVRARQDGMDMLLRRNQDLIMKIIVIDRENEQALLRRGLLPPNQLPSSHRQRPHAVAEQYLKNLPA